MFGERLKRARSAAGLSMKALGQQAGVSANMIKKYEHGESMPSSGVLVKMSRTLKVRNEYFFRPTKYELNNIEYRKRSSTTVKTLERIKSDILDQAERWMELHNLWPNLPVKEFEIPNFSISKIEKYSQVDLIAQELRDKWKLGRVSITNMIDLLESQGIIVIITEVDSNDKFDGCQTSLDGKPLVVISSKWPGDRQRFTLGHELGHLILHDLLDPSLSEEHACNYFSGAFLFPKEMVESSLGKKRRNLEAQELYLLKKEFGLSMQAIVYRAKFLEIINDSQAKSIIIDFSKKGWRREEPGDAYPREKTQAFEQLVFRGLAEDILTESKSAELLGMSLLKFHHIRKLELTDDCTNK